MLVKLTSKNQLTLPTAILDMMPDTIYFEVEARDDRIVLTPLRISRVDIVREKLAQLGITEQDVEDAVQWARKSD
jgi:hypothetical protein